jgi:hypothetical protein
LKAKLLRPFGQRSDLLLAIPVFMVFDAFGDVLRSLMMSLWNKQAKFRAMAAMALGAPNRVR